MPGAQMVDERRAVGAWLVAEPQRRRVATVDEDDTFQPTERGGQLRPQLGHTGDCLLPASDLHGPPRYTPDQPLPGGLAYGTGLRQRSPCLAGGVQDGAGQWVLRVSLQGGDQHQHFPPVPALSRDQFCQAWLPVCQRASLVKNGRTARFDLL